MKKDPKTETLTILVIGSSKSYRDQVVSILERSAKFQIYGLAPGDPELKAMGGSADAIVLSVESLGTGETALLSSLRSSFPTTPILVISDHLDDAHVRELFHFNVQDWLARPIDALTLIESVDVAVRTTRTTSNSVHAVISGSAGAGATVLAAQMADILAGLCADKGQSVALVDLDFSSGNAGYALNMVNSYDLSSVMSHPERIDVEFANLIRERHKRGFYLFSFKHPELVVDPGGRELVLRLLDAVNVQHSHTVLDIPYYQTGWHEEVLAAVNTCTIVTELNLPALHQALDVLKALRVIHGPDVPIRIVINKNKSRLFGAAIDKKDLRELFGDTPIWRLPDDGKLITESLNRGKLPKEVSRRAGFVVAVERYARDLLETAGARP